MEEEKTHTLLQPLISSITRNSISTVSIGCSTTHGEDDNNINYDSGVVSSNSGIIFRFSLIIFIGLISIWANHEASKGHSITIVNEADGTPGRRFHLFYESNGKASRLVYDTSKFVENFLYPNASHHKKQVNHVILRFSSRNMVQTVAVESLHNEEYVLYISSSVMDEVNHGYAMFLAVQKGMIHIWLWDGEGEAPPGLVNGIVEYITQLALGNSKSLEKMVAQPGCWRSKNPKAMAEFLSYYEVKKPGFIGWLNQELRKGWHDQTVDEALGIPIQHLCLLYNSSISI